MKATVSCDTAFPCISTALSSIKHSKQLSVIRCQWTLITLTDWRLCSQQKRRDRVTCPDLGNSLALHSHLPCMLWRIRSTGHFLLHSKFEASLSYKRKTYSPNKGSRTIAPIFVSRYRNVTTCHGYQKRAKQHVTVLSRWWGENYYFLTFILLEILHVIELWNKNT